MAQVFACDGCDGVTEFGDLTEHGFGRKKLYCPSCHTSVAEYETARDELHSKLALDWVTGIGKLQEKWRKAHPTGKLPDEGDS